MLCIAKALDTRGFSSIFNFPNTALPENSIDNCSIIREIVLRGPHQAAQKSTIKKWYLFTNPVKIIIS